MGKFRIGIISAFIFVLLSIPAQATGPEPVIDPQSFNKVYVEQSSSY